MRNVTRWFVAFILIFAPMASFAAPKAPQKEVDIWIARDVAPGPKIRVSLNTRNVGTVHMSALRSQDVKLLIKRPKITGRPANTVTVKEWNVSMIGKKESARPGDIYRSKQTNLPPLPPGIYIIAASGGGITRWAIVNITNLSVVVKRSQREVLTWVTDARTGRLISGVRVTLYKDSGQSIKSGTTASDGVSVLKTPPGNSQTIIVTRGRDLAAVPCSNTTTDGKLTAHIQTDRPIYRPGQTVLFKAVLRRTKGRVYTPLANETCTVQAMDTKDNVIYEKKLTTNAIGSLSDQIEIPSEGPLGSHSITIAAGKDTQYYSFEVAEYRKPEFKVEVKPGSKRYLAGEDVTFNVDASYYFGAPLPQASVTYEVTRENNLYYGSLDETDDWYADRSGNMDYSDIYGGADFSAEGTVYTDKDGKVSITIKTDKKAPDSVYHIHCTVQDATRRQVEASAGAPVYAASLRLGISSNVLVAPVGGLIPIQLKAADLDGKPTSANVTVAVRKYVYDAKHDRYEPKDLTSTKIAIPANGKASAKLPAKAEGELTIVATAFDPTGRKTSASLSIWVANPSASFEKEEAGPTLSLKPDRRSYEPGQTAKIWVSANTPRPVLLTLTGLDIFDHHVVPAGKKGFLWSVKTSVEMSPNAYAEADQWSKSDRVSANALLRIPDRTRKLAVEIDPDKTAYRPGDTASWTIHTTGSDGKPVPAEACVSVVDESIYAIKPDNTTDPYAFFWGIRENNTITNSSAPEELSGGAFQRSAPAMYPSPLPSLGVPAGAKIATVRQKFLDTAYWNANVMTDMDGTAKVSFEIPGNLTSWRGKALAITEDTRTGQDKTSVQASRPAMLRLATPRQMVQGDKLRLKGTINNRSEQAHAFNVELSGEGVTIEGLGAQTVTVPAKGEATVEWQIAANSLPDSGYGSLTGVLFATDVPAASVEEYSDALKVDLRIAPNGIEQRILLGGALQDRKDVTLDLPADRIEPASVVIITARAGLKQVVDDLAKDVLASGRYCTSAAADQLEVAALAGLNSQSKDVRESIALLSRYQQSSGGWGWWENDRQDPVTTARVLIAVARARKAGIEISKSIVSKGIEGAASQYRQTNLWEHRALLAAAMELAQADMKVSDWTRGQTDNLLEEVHRRGENISPYARLLLAEAYARSDELWWAKDEIAAVFKDAVVGPETAYVPVGDRPGWSTSTAEATAQALIALMALPIVDDRQAKLAQWLASPEDDTWLSDDEQAQAATALAAYLRKHPDPAKPGKVQLAVNGNAVEYAPDTNKSVRIFIHRDLLKSGQNTISLGRDGGGELFYSVEARVYVPAEHETRSGIRVVRKYETQNAAGMWEEVVGTVKPSAAIRCTTLVWPDNKPDGLRVVEPMPAGFEFIDSDRDSVWAREEVRDAAVVHYLRSYGDPVSFRYYLRAESEGDVTAPAAWSEAIRRPAFRGNSSAFEVQVTD